MGLPIIVKIVKPKRRNLVLRIEDFLTNKSELGLSLVFETPMFE